MLETWYREGGITIINADCLLVLPGLSTKSVDLVLTDPPYGVGIAYDSYDDTETNWFALMSKVLPELKRVAKMVILPSCQIKRLYWIYTNFPPDWLICWYKGSTGCAAYIGFNDWEPHLVYGKTDRLYMHDFFQARNDEKLGNYGHPCPKPLAWADWFIQKATKENDIVLDPFMGSGTVLVSAKKNNRKAIGIDISKGYCDIAVGRLSEINDN